MSESPSPPSSDFAVGDIVRLVSGGPKMTVRQVEHGDEEDTIHVVWFTPTSRELMTGRFPASTIYIAPTRNHDE